MQVIVLLIVADIGLHYTSYNHFGRSFDNDRRFFYTYDSALGYDMAISAPLLERETPSGVKYKAWTNNIGCYDHEYAANQDYILLVGDSFTESTAPFDKKWGTLLEKLLKHRVLKCGIVGYGTKAELMKANKTIDRTGKSPKLIIVGYYMNDLENDYIFPSATVIDGYFMSTKMLNRTTGAIEGYPVQSIDYIKWQRDYCSDEPVTGHYNKIIKRTGCYLSRNSIILNMMKKAKERISEMVQNMPGDNDRHTILPVQMDISFFPSDHGWILENKLWNNHFANIKEFQKLAMHHNAKLLFVLIPTREQVYPYLLSKQYRNSINLFQPNEILAEFFRRESIGYLDLLPLFSEFADKTERNHLDNEKDLYWRNDSHWSNKGDRLASVFVAKKLIESGIITSGDSKRILAELNNF